MDELPFPGDSNFSQSINAIVEKLLCFDAAKERISIDSLVENISIESIPRIIGESARYDSLLNEFESLKYKPKNAICKSIEIKRARSYVDAALNDVSCSAMDNLSSIVRDLKKSRNNIQIISDLRKKADDTDDVLYGNDQIPGLLSITGTHAGCKVRRYHRDRPDREELSRDVAKVEERYLLFHESSDVGEELESLMKETRSGIFSSRIVRKGRKARFYEGLVRIKELREEIKHVSRNPKHYLSLRDEIERHSDDIEKAIPNLSIGNIESYQGINPDRYSNQRSFYLQKSLSRYRAASAELKQKISYLVEQEKKSIDAKVEELKEQSRNVDHEGPAKIKELNRSIKRLEKSCDKVGYGAKKEEVNEISEDVDGKLMIFNPGRSENPAYHSSLFPEYVSSIKLPMDFRYKSLRDALLSPSDGWLSSMIKLDSEAKRLIACSDMSKTDYPMRLYEAVKEFYEKGHLGNIAKFNSQNRQIIESSLNSLHDLADKMA